MVSPGGFDPGEQDEARHHQAHPAVDVQAGPLGDEHGQQHGGGGRRIGQAVGGGGLHGGGADFLADPPVIQAHIQLHADGHRQDHQGDDAEIHRRRVEDFLH